MVGAIEKGKEVAPTARNRADGPGSRVGSRQRPEPTPESEAFVLAFLIIVFIAGSAYFWHRYGKFFEACLDKGHTQEYCHSLLR